MRAAARLDPDPRWRQLCKKRRHLPPSQALLQHHLSGQILGVNLENRLRNIEPDRDSLHRDGLPRWSLHRPQLGTSDAVRGPSTQHCERSEAISVGLIGFLSVRHLPL
jgi:hypothetical protein